MIIIEMFEYLFEFSSMIFFLLYNKLNERVGKIFFCQSFWLKFVNKFDFLAHFSKKNQGFPECLFVHQSCKIFLLSTYGIFINFDHFDKCVLHLCNDPFFLASVNYMKYKSFSLPASVRIIDLVKTDSLLLGCRFTWTWSYWFQIFGLFSLPRFQKLICF